MAEVMVPVSIGELMDKITILRIKREHIKEPTKLKNIETELQALVGVCKKSNLDPQSPLVLDLEQINRKLWKIEDDIRDLERSKTFTQPFIDLARAVYVTNDERFQAKSRINVAFGSAFQEEKSYKPY